MCPPVEEKMAAMAVNDKKPAPPKAEKKAKKPKGNESDYPLEVSI